MAIKKHKHIYFKETLTIFAHIRTNMVWFCSTVTMIELLFLPSCYLTGAVFGGHVYRIEPESLALEASPTHFPIDDDQSQNVVANHFVIILRRTASGNYMFVIVIFIFPIPIKTSAHFHQRQNRHFCSLFKLCVINGRAFSIFSVFTILRNSMSNFNL